MSEQAIVLEGQVTDRGVGPAMPVRDVAARYQQLASLAHDVMRPNVDFGIVPGTGDKPTLLKPGAEKLAVFFGLEVRFVLADRVEDWAGGFFFYRYECVLYHRATGQRIANAYGSCNSKEKKYRWRHVPEFKATAEEKALAVGREERRSKGGTPWVLLTIENAEPWELANTIDKMAQKRALVAAILVGTGASEFFTQDVEDLADFAPAEPAPVPAKAGGQDNGGGQEAPVAESHWAEDPKKLAAFHAELKKIGATHEDAHCYLGVKHLTDWHNTAAVAIRVIRAAKDAEIEASRPAGDDGEFASNSHAEGAQ